MASHPLPHLRETSPLTRWLATGFIAGALAVLIFHQPAFALLHDLGLTPRAPFAMQATAPFGVPQLWSIAFWGGAWGLVLAAALRRYHGGGLLLAATVFGLILPTLVAWFVVAPLKGQPMAAGFAPAGMAVGLIVNAVWGFGTGLGLMLFGRGRSH